MLDLFENLINCVYSPDMDVPSRLDPDFEARYAEYLAEEAKGVEAFKRDLFAHYGVSGERAEHAFQVAYERERSGGFYAIAELFEQLLPLVREVH